MDSMFSSSARARFRSPSTSLHHLACFVLYDEFDTHWQIYSRACQPLGGFVATRLQLLTLQSSDPECSSGAVQGQAAQTDVDTVGSKFGGRSLVPHRRA